MNRLFPSMLPVILLAALALAACSAAPATPAANGAPPPNTSTPTFTPSPSPNPTLTFTSSPTSTPLSYDGRWDGGTESNGLLSGELLFQVENNKVTEIALDYTLRNSGCTLISSYRGTADQATTESNSFSAEMAGDGKVLTLTGTFTAPKEASGTLEFRGKMEGCPDFDRTVKWTAQNVPIPPTATPTETPLPKTVQVARRDGDLTLLPNGDVQFIETWNIHFNGGPFQLAYRAWLFGGYDSIGDWGVSENERAYRQDTSQAPYTFTVTKANAQNTLTWYFPPTTSETRTFVLRYTVHGGFRPNRADNSWVWKFIEADRSYAIDSSRVTVHLPDGMAPDQVTATTLQNGEPGKGGTVLDGRTIEFDDGPFPPYTDWQLSVRFPGGTGIVTPTAAAAGYDGEWQGFNSKGDPVFFHVEKNQIGYMLINYTYAAGACRGGGAQGGIVANAPIEEDRFTATFTDAEGTSFSLVGKFTSPTRAEGTFDVKGKAICGNADFEAKDTWSAVNTSVAKTPTPDATTSAAPVLGREFSLKLGQTATMDDGLVVTFEDVPSDGRCSSCTASYSAAVKLSLTVPGKSPSPVVLTTPPLSGIEGDPSPYSIRFVRLAPQRIYPNDPLDPADYLVTLVITKSE